MAETLLALITAQLLGDFVFQTRRMVEQQKQIFVLLLHVLIVTAILAGFFPQASANGWWPEPLSHLLPWLYTAMCLLSGVILIVPVGGIVIGKLTEPIRAEAEKIAILSTDSFAAAPSAATGQHLIAGLRNGGR